MSNYAIEIKNLDFAYKNEEIFKKFNLKIARNKTTAILGHNGSGKSTLAKLIIGLLDVNGGEIIVDNKLLNADNIDEIRKNTGLVFQNPDNQFVGISVIEDIAFGLENHQVPHEEMESIIKEYADKVGMLPFLEKNPQELSGGQKQRVAIAGVLCLNPSILILDEATSMLDPQGKEEVIKIVEKIRNIQKDITIISITHDIDEALFADEIVVLNKGKLVFQGKPEDAIMQEGILKSSKIELPPYIELAKELKKRNIISEIKATKKDLENQIKNAIEVCEKNKLNYESFSDNSSKISKSEMAKIKLEFTDVSFNYQPYNKKSKNALDNVNIKLNDNDVVAILGHTGSGKSTFIQHLNALLTPTSGKVQIGEKIILGNKKNRKLKCVRKEVGLVFQFPEYQLFEETVAKDIMYGAINFGASKEEALSRALEVAKTVGIDDDILEKLPFKLSGGQMRKVAIAGILAIEPKVLVLDEPTVGLDPLTRRLLLKTIMDISEKADNKVILVTHDMNVVNEYANRCVVFNEGRIVFNGETSELFNNEEIIETCALSYPDIFSISKNIFDHLKANGEIKKLDISKMANLIEILAENNNELERVR